MGNKAPATDEMSGDSVRLTTVNDSHQPNPRFY